MKTCLLFAVTCVASTALAWTQVLVPKAMLTIEVVDEAGAPVPNGGASIWVQVQDKDAQRVGTTDGDGRMTAELPSFGYLYYSAGRDGYYSAWGRYQFENGAMSGDHAKWAERKWLPWNPVVRLTLKKKGQPIAMHVRRICLAPPVVDGTPVGFDLEVGDWLAPHGEGKQADIFFSATGSIEKGDLALTWSFPNEGDGVVVYPYQGGARSELRSPIEAPLDGYLPKITVDAEGRPTQQTGGERPLSYVFRVRTVLDAAGKIISSRYGKIYPEAYKAVFYLNPTPNSRALEFDLKRNLITGLRGYERINEP